MNTYSSASSHGGDGETGARITLPLQRAEKLDKIYETVVSDIQQ